MEQANQGLSPTQQKYRKIVQQMDDYLKNAKAYRNQWEVRSYVNQSFYEGNHQVVWNPSTRQFDTIPIKSENGLVVGKVRKIVRGVRNSIVRNDPRWHAGLGGEEAASEEELKAAYVLLNSAYKRCHVKDKLKDLITHGCIKTTAWMFVGFDAEKQDFDIFVEDPYNIYTSPDGRLE